MAKLIPQTHLQEIELKPERDTAIALVEQLPDDAVVFHSYPWLKHTDNGSHYLTQGEADFLVVLKDHGILVLEVKGGEIVYNPDNRGWFRQLPYEQRKIKDPFEQAGKSLHFVKDKIRNEVYPSQGELPFAYGFSVVFPDCDYSGDAPPGAAHATILSARDLEHFDRRIPAAISAWSRGKDKLGIDDLKRVTKALTSTFNLVPLLSKQIKSEYEKLVRLTKQQANILRTLNNHKRCLIEGVAGSGKTMLAVEKARLFAEEGKKTLVLCYNLNLAKWLRETLDSEHAELIDVFGFHEFCEFMAKKAGLKFEPGEDKQEFFAETAPALLLEATGILEDRYDAIVVDEGQDFRSSWWTALEFLCSLPEETPLYVFFDRSQNLYVEDLKLPEFGEPFFLGQNCRNTKSIVNLCADICDVEIDTHWDAPTGKAIEIEVCKDVASQRAMATRAIKRFTKGDLDPSQIVILSPYTKGNPKHSSFDVEKLAGISLVDSTEEWQAGKGILFATIKAFKGLEADAVILVDIPNPENDKYFTSNDLYVGVSRAKHFLSILTREDFLKSEQTS